MYLFISKVGCEVVARSSCGTFNVIRLYANLKHCMQFFACELEDLNIHTYIHQTKNEVEQINPAYLPPSTRFNDEHTRKYVCRFLSDCQILSALFLPLGFLEPLL